MAENTWVCNWDVIILLKKAVVKTPVVAGDGTHLNRDSMDGWKTCHVKVSVVGVDEVKPFHRRSECRIPETWNEHSFPLKMDGCKSTFLLGTGLFTAAFWLVWGRVICFFEKKHIESCKVFFWISPRRFLTKSKIQKCTWKPNASPLFSGTVTTLQKKAQTLIKTVFVDVAVEWFSTFTLPLKSYTPFPKGQDVLTLFCHHFSGVNSLLWTSGVYTQPEPKHPKHVETAGNAAIMMEIPIVEN